MALARIHEEKYMAMRYSWKTTYTTLPSHPSNSTKPSVTTSSNILPSSSTPPNKINQIPFKRLSPEDMRIRREKGLCFNCDEKYKFGHKCKSRFFLLVADEEEEEEEEELDPILTKEVADNKPEESCEMEVLPEVSIHALGSQLNPKTIRVYGKCGVHNIQILIDSGSTHNFLQEKVANRLGLQIQPSMELKVYIGSRDYLVCKKRCTGVKLNLQGHKFIVDLFILPIQGADMVLGIQWLEQLGPVLTDHKLLTMKFNWQGKDVQIVGVPQLHPTPIPAKQLKKLTSSKHVASM